MTDWSSGGLYTLPGEALTILRFFAGASSEAAHSEAIMEGTGLSDRGFGKGIRRLVTRNYLTLSGEQVYRLTEQGRRAIRELNEAGDLPAGRSSDDGGDDARFVRRRLILVTPAVLPADRAARITVGFDDPDDDDRLDVPSNILVRLNMVNGEPSRSQEISLALDNQFAQQMVSITAGAFTRARLRAEVFQFKDSEDDYEFCGGMYIDLAVQRQPDALALAPRAYGMDVILRDSAG
ncbi:MAG: hypothetical protein SGJ24_00940 [Chloroflexota bacterium]|nr:hypothetical protein [Chloroflexota bacterium]